MKNYIQLGENLTFTVSGSAVVGGNGQLIGDTFGVVAGDAAVGEDAVLSLVGVFEIDAKTADAWSQGAKLYWDDTAKELTDTASGKREVGVAWADKAASATVAQIKLNNTSVRLPAPDLTQDPTRSPPWGPGDRFHPSRAGHTPRTRLGSLMERRRGRQRVPDDGIRRDGTIVATMGIDVTYEHAAGGSETIRGVYRRTHKEIDPETGTEINVRRPLSASGSRAYPPSPWPRPITSPRACGQPDGSMAPVRYLVVQAIRGRTTT